MTDQAKIALSSTFAMHAVMFDTPMPEVESISGVEDGEDLAIAAVTTEEHGWTFWLAAADVHGAMTLVELTTAGAIQLREALGKRLLEGVQTSV